MLQWLQDHAPACMFKVLTGIDCPGCGMTRALFALIRGDLMASLAYNPALIPLLITVTALMIQLKIKHPKGGLYIIWLFSLTSAIAMINFGVKQYLLISGHH
jgi:hypothetical protein